LKEVDTGKEKVKKICDVLRRETLEPAKLEAEEIIRQAKLQATEIVNSAKAEAEKNKAAALEEIEKQKTVFTTSLHQAGKQSLEALKNEIETKLFNPALFQMFNRPLTEEKVILDLIEAVVEALKRDGIDANLDVYIPSKVSAKEINSQLIQRIGEELKSSTLSLGPIEGGITVKLSKENITIDITDQALKEWVSRYVRQDFRELLFGVS
jgi:V/A-type H+/Na+-transporting ATPase subunit E